MKDGERLFLKTFSDRTGSNGVKLKEMRVVRYWNGLPREVVGASSLEVFSESLWTGF